MRQRFHFLILLSIGFTITQAYADTIEVISVSNVTDKLKYLEMATAKVLPMLNPFNYCYVDQIKFLPNAILKDTARLNQQINWYLSEEIKQAQLLNKIRLQQTQFWNDKQRERNLGEESNYQDEQEPPPPLCVRSVSFKPLFFAEQYFACLLSYEYVFSINGDEHYNTFYKVLYFNLENGNEVKATNLFEPKSELELASFLTISGQNKLEANKATFIETFVTRHTANMVEEGEGENDENPEAIIERDFKNWKEKFSVLAKDLDELIYMPTPAGLSVLILPYAFGKESSTYPSFQFILSEAEVQRLFKPSALITIGFSHKPSIAKQVNLIKQRNSIFAGSNFPLEVDPWREADAQMSNMSKLVFRNQGNASEMLQSPIHVVRYNQLGLPKQFIQLDGQDTSLIETYTYNKEKQLLSFIQTQENGKQTKILMLRYDKQNNLSFVKESTDENTENASIEKTHYLLDSNLVYEYNEVDFFDGFETIFNQFRVHEINSYGLLLRTRLLNRNFDWEYKYNTMGFLLAYYPYSNNLGDFRIYTYNSANKLNSIESGNQQYSFLIDRNSDGQPLSISAYNNIYLQSKTTYRYNSAGLLSEMRGSGSDVYTFKYKRE